MYELNIIRYDGVRCLVARKLNLTGAVREVGPLLATFESGYPRMTAPEGVEVTGPGGVVLFKADNPWLHGWSVECHSSEGEPGPDDDVWEAGAWHPAREDGTEPEDVEEEEAAMDHLTGWRAVYAPGQREPLRTTQLGTMRGDDDDDWKREQAMLAGMAFGCQGYNDVMGW